jgi:hypothetical protein
VRGANLACATAAYAAVLDMDSATAAQSDALAARQSALVGIVAAHIAQQQPDSALRQISRSLERGDGGSSLAMVGAAVSPAFARMAAEVAANDAVRFGADMARCSTPERCWILAQYFRSLGQPAPPLAIARALAERAQRDTSSELSRYAAAADAHARLASGDSTGAVRALRAVLARPLPPGTTLTWYPFGGLGAERLLLSQLLLARGEFSEAMLVAASLDAAAPASFPLYLLASLDVRKRAATALRDTNEAGRLQTRIDRLSLQSPRAAAPR